MNLRPSLLDAAHDLKQALANHDEVFRLELERALNDFDEFRYRRIMQQMVNSREPYLAALSEIAMKLPDPRVLQANNPAPILPEYKLGGGSIDLDIERRRAQRLQAMIRAHDAIAPAPNPSPR